MRLCESTRSLWNNTRVPSTAILPQHRMSQHRHAYPYSLAYMSRTACLLHLVHVGCGNPFQHTKEKRSGIRRSRSKLRNRKECYYIPLDLSRSWSWSWSRWMGKSLSLLESGFGFLIFCSGRDLMSRLGISRERTFLCDLICDCRV